MRLPSLFILAALFLSGCASGPLKLATNDRVSINVPALSADLQSVRSPSELKELKRRYAMKVTLTVAKALELHVPADYSIFPGAGVDLSQQLVLDRSRSWSDALPEALEAIGIEVEFDAVGKTIRLRQSRTSLFTDSNK